ncbi:MAG: sporulation integral membrane protein YtvI [Ruminococcaceae bacterium]|nr:sporulation integral membrane protein YtvI [Oscillospiraceae bacterium]
MVTEKRKTFLVNFAYFGIILLLAFAALRYALPLLMPFAIAFAIAYILKTPIHLMTRTLRLPDKLSAILAVILFYTVAGALLTLASIKAVSAIASLIGSLPGLYETYAQPYFMEILLNIEAVLVSMEPSLAAVFDDVGREMIQSLGQLISSLSVRVMAIATNLASAVPGLFIKLVLMIISSFFIAVDYDRLTGFCLRQMSEHAKAIFFEIREYVAGTLLVCIRSYIIIMSITFAELSVGLSLLGIRHAIMLAFVIAIFDLLPVLGTGGIMIPWTILTVIKGNYPLALGLLILYLVITVIRNIIEPKIVGSQLGLHPVITLCSMFAGAQLLGVVGLFGFPIGLSLLRHLNDRSVIKLFR